MKAHATVSSSLFVCLKPLNLTLLVLALLSSALCKDAPARDDTTPRPAAPKAEARLPKPAQQASNPLTLSAANQMLQGQRLLFIENRGQFDTRVKFLVKGNGANLWLTNDGIVFDFQRPAAKQDSAAMAEKSGAATTSSFDLRHFDPRLKSDPTPMERLVFKQKLVGASTNSTIEARDPQPGIYNYFIGSDPDKWRTHVLAYKEVVYRDIWKGIDLQLFANGTNLEEEFVVHPGADASAVRLAYEGVQRLTVGDDGSLKVATAFGEVTETSPRIYQEIAGKPASLSGTFKVGAQNSYTFEVAKHDEQADLIIDPTVIYSKPRDGKKAGQGSLLYSTYIGGTAGNDCCGPTEYAAAIAVDASGNAYITGVTPSQDFPVTPGAYQTQNPNTAPFITKFNPLGSQLVYSTFLGADGSYGTGIAVDSNGDAYIVGHGDSSIPTTPNALQSPIYGPFLTVFGPQGDSLLYSTGFNGPGETIYAVAIDSQGRAYMTGHSDTTSCFLEHVPTTPNAFDTTNGAAFIVVLDPSQSGQASLIYGSCLGGSTQPDRAYGIAVDAYNMAYVAGYTFNSDFPVTPGAFQTTLHGDSDAFLTKFNPFASTGPASVLYSTYLGGEGPDTASAVVVDSMGNATIGGLTRSTQFPTTPGALEPVWQSEWGAGTGYVSKMNAAGNQLVYSTFWGGNDASILGLAVDSGANIYATGFTDGDLLVSQNAYQQNSGGDQDILVSELDPQGGLLYSSYLGGTANEGGYGIAVDAIGDAYLTGFTGSVDFPITQGAYQLTLKPCNCYYGPEDAFVTKFPLGGSGTLSITGMLPNSGGNAGSVTARILGTGFHQGAIVQLSLGGSYILPQTTSVGIEGRTITTTFDLTGASPGIYDVIVTNPDGSHQTLPQGFTVVSGGAANIWVQIIGPQQFRRDVETPFFMVYGNNGADDAFDVPLWMSGFPNDATLDVQVNPPPPPFGDGINWAHFPPIIQAGTQQEISGMVNRVPVFYQTGFFPVGVTFPGDGESATLNAWTSPFYNLMSLSGLQPEGQVCSQTVAEQVYQALTSQLPNNDCLNTAAAAYRAALLSAAVSASKGDYSWKDYFVAYVETLLSCMTQGKADNLVNSAIDTWMTFIGSNDDGDGGQCFGKDAQGQASTQAVSSGDPNSLAGALGVGQTQWVAGSAPLPYDIAFGNDPGASAPAQRVVITDTLATNLSWPTLGLKDISFTGIHVPIPPTFAPLAGLYQFSTNVDLRPTQNLFVAVSASLNPNTGLLSWVFQSIDPTTGLPPINPLVGFLPPGGNGDVVFTVAPTSGLATGTQISDQATIVFDNNPPQNTNIWTNTLDNTPPTSHVSALPGTELCSNFTVQWSGTDVGSGIGNYTIYVSDDGGSFTAWQSNTTSTSAVFNGQVGHRYGFYSIAQDLVGNVEPGKTSAEATTQVNKGTICGPVGPPTPLGSSR